MRKDNKGVTLVELLIAISIAAIVSASIAYLLKTSLHMYGNETTDVALQQELQITINQIMDYAMESQAVVVSGNDTATDFVVLGTIVPKEGTEKAKLDAQVIWKDGDKLYLKKQMIDDIEDATADGSLVLTAQSTISSVSSNKDNYLLAEYVDSFKVGVSGIISGTTEYDNPLSLNISIGFAKQGSARNITKDVSDKAVLRNRISLPIFVNGAKYTKKRESSEAEVVTETKTVNLEEYLGDIHYVETGESTKKARLTVLEVIPKPYHAIMGYLVGGKEPIDSDGMDAAANHKVGHLGSEGLQPGRGTGSIANNKTLFGYDLGSNTIPNFFMAGGLYKGYFEKVSYNDPSVRRGRGGVYAIDRECSNFTNLKLISEYTSYSDNAYSYTPSDFCWVWKEDSNVNGQGFSEGGSVSNATTSFKIEELLNAPVGAKIYFQDCQKHKIINNEMFILHCMGYDQSRGNYGLVESIWGDSINYNFNNQVELSRFNKDNVKFLSYTPGELKDHEDDLKNADLVMFIAPSNTIYQQAGRVLAVEEPDKTDNLAYAYTSDITFDEMRYIYSKVITSELGIACSRVTSNDAASFKNLSNLFYMLYEFENSNIVYSNGSFYGPTENRYHIKDEEKVHSSDAGATSLWSGRVMFSDFFSQNYEGADKLAYSYSLFTEDRILPNGSGYYTAADFLHYDGSGNIIVGPRTSYNGSSWGTRSFTSWKNNLIGDYNNFCQFGSLRFLLDEYYKKAGFRPTNPPNQLGVYANQAKFEDNGLIIGYSKNSNTGSLAWIGNIVGATHNSRTNPYEDPVIGSIEVVGYGIGEPVSDPSDPDVGKGRFNRPADTSGVLYEESGVTYQHTFEEMTGANKAKVMYLTDYEIEQAMDPSDYGIYVYILVKSSVDLAANRSYFPMIKYVKNEAAEWKVVNTYDVVWPEGAPIEPGALVRYKGGTAKNERYVTEFRIHIPFFYLINFTPPTNYGNNRMIASIGEPRTGEIEGSDVFYIVGRDAFDLD